MSFGQEYTVEFKFPGDANWYDMSKHTLVSNFQKEKMLWNSLTPTANSCSFKMKYDPTIGSKFVNNEYESIQVRIDSEDGSYFRGWVEPGLQLISASRAEWINVKCIDRYIELKKSIDQDYNWINYRLINNTNKSESIIHQLCVNAGIDLSDIQLTEYSGSTVVIPFFKIRRNIKSQERSWTSPETWAELLQEVLMNYRQTYFFSDEGKFINYSFDPLSSSTINTFNNENIHGKLILDKKQPKHDSSAVHYYNLLYFENYDNFDYVSETVGDETITLQPTGNIPDYLPHNITIVGEEIFLASGDGGEAKHPYTSILGEVWGVTNLRTTGLSYESGSEYKVNTNIENTATVSKSSNITNSVVNAYDGDTDTYVYLRQAMAIGSQTSGNITFDFATPVTINSMKITHTLFTQMRFGEPAQDIRVFFTIQGQSEAFWGTLNNPFFTIDASLGQSGWYIPDDMFTTTIATDWSNIVKIRIECRVYGVGRYHATPAFKRSDTIGNVVIRNIEIYSAIETGDVEVVEWNNYYDSYGFKLRNLASTEKKIFTIKAIGDGYILENKTRDAKGGRIQISSLGNGDNRYLFEAQYIWTDEEALSLAQALSSYFYNSSWKYTFKSRTLYEPGDFVEISDVNYPILNKRCVVVARKDIESEQTYVYTCEGIENE